MFGVIEKLKKGQLREIERKLEKIYGISLPKNLEYFRRKERVYGIKKEKLKVLEDLKGVRIENIGIKLVVLDKDGIRLTIEGAQILGKDAKKNVVEIEKEDVERFMSGEDIENYKGNPDYVFVIVKSGNDILGTARVLKSGMLRPYIPKERRIPRKYVENSNVR